MFWFLANKATQSNKWDGIKFIILCQLLFARGHYKAEYWVLSLHYSSFAYFLLFLPARRYASAANSYRNLSVRLSSVCLSHAGIVSKRRKLASWCQISSWHSKGFPRAGASNKGGIGKLGVTLPWPRPFWSKNTGGHVRIVPKNLQLHT